MYKISCVDLRIVLKNNLIQLINHFASFKKNLFGKIQCNNDPNDKIRINFVENMAINSHNIPLISELQNLWHILLDYREELSDEIKKLSLRPSIKLDLGKIKIL